MAVIPANPSAVHTKTQSAEIASSTTPVLTEGVRLRLMTDQIMQQCQHHRGPGFNGTVVLANLSAQGVSSMIADQWWPMHRLTGEEQVTAHFL
jgi:hypothetical protein